MTPTDWAATVLIVYFAVASILAVLVDVLVKKHKD